MTMQLIKRLVFASLILTILALPPVLSMFTGHGAVPGILTSAGILSATLFLFFFKALWSRRKEKKFIDGLTAQSPDDGFSEQPLSHELSRRWKEAVSHLRSSRLRLQGNPLYVLPWYMVMGESGSGKTTAIRNSGLSSPLGSPSGSTGTSGTRNCDWWFFEQAVILDTAGRYTTQPDENRDRDEWRLFLTQLSKYRKKEPLNGLLVTVAADRLISSSESELLNEGRTIRCRVEELMQVLGVRFPVYVLVTKCDLVPGIRNFAGRLPETARKQAMGSIGFPESDGSEPLLDRVFTRLKDRLRQVVLHMAGSKHHEKLDLDLLLLPGELHRIKQGLEPFIHGAFSHNAYREAPFLRGLYFTSARQDRPHLPGSTAKTGPEASRDQSCFLQDLFASILPADRSLFTPTRRSLTFKLKTRILGYSAWILAFIVLCGLGTTSFGKTLLLVRQAGQDLAESGSIASIPGRFNQALDQLDRFRKAVAKVEIRNSERWIPELGLTQGSQMEKEAKALFCRKFSGDFLMAYDREMDRDARQFSDATPSFSVGRTVAHYARRIRLLDKALEGADLKTLKSLASPDFSWLVTRKDRGLTPEDTSRMESLYLHYLVWETRDGLETEKKRLHSQLVHLAGKPDLSLRWMIDWCNENAGGNPLTRQSFWGGSRNVSPDEKVRPAFTAQGFRMIMDILDELENSLENPGDLNAKKTGFLSWYRETYRKTWLKFAVAFPGGAATLAGPGEKMTVAKNIAAGRGPCVALLDVMARELPVCLDEHEPAPEWISRILEFSAVRNHVEKPEAATEQDLAGTVKKKGLAFLEKSKPAALGGISQEALTSKGDIYLRYKQSLENLALTATSRPSAFKLATDVFTEDPAMGQSALAVSLRHADELKTTLAHRTGTGAVADRLIDSPMDFLWSLAAEKAACHMQDLWNETVLAEVQGVRDPKVKADMLMGKDGGLVQTFVKGPAAPFIGRDARRGYYSRNIGGKTLVFNNAFLAYLTKSSISAKSEQGLYKVRIDGMPTDTNPEAGVLPHMTRLELQCSGSAQVLNYLNYPAGRQFEWNPDECGDVLLQVGIGDLTLKRLYTGPRAFPRFLKDFEKGQRAFGPRDFPESDSALKRMNVRFVKVRYRISGSRSVVSVLNSSAGKAPEIIVPCSD